MNNKKIKLIVTIAVFVAILVSGLLGKSFVDKDKLGQTQSESSLSSSGQNETKKQGQTTKSGSDTGSTDKKAKSTTDAASNAKTNAKSDKSYTLADLDTLKNTQNFNSSAVEHIFNGTAKRGVASGYHYEGITDSKGKVIEGSRSKEDSHGVYTGKVQVDGYDKSGNSGTSTFYPKSFSPQDVVDCINEAYANLKKVSGSDNTYRGKSKSGITVEMYLDDNKKIISAFPLKE
jgi:hypothetical protein